MILLSLDALEQALDGGANPVIPSQPPAPPRPSATPSFVPEPVAEEPPSPPESVEPEPVALEPAVHTDPVIHAPEYFPTQGEAEIVQGPDSALPVAEEVLSPTVSPEAGPSKLSTEDIPDAPASVPQAAEPEKLTGESMTDPIPEPSMERPDIQVMEAVSPQPQMLSAAPSALQLPEGKAPPSTNGISLEERFFLDF